MTEKMLRGISYGFCWAGAMALGHWYNGDPLWHNVVLVGAVATLSWWEGRSSAQ